MHSSEQKYRTCIIIIIIIYTINAPYEAGLNLGRGQKTNVVDGAFVSAEVAQHGASPRVPHRQRTVH